MASTTLLLWPRPTSASPSAVRRPTSRPRRGTSSSMGDPLKPLPMLVRLSRETVADHSAEHHLVRVRRQRGRHPRHRLALAPGHAGKLVRTIAYCRRHLSSARLLAGPAQFDAAALVRARRNQRGMDCLERAGRNFDRWLSTHLDVGEGGTTGANITGKAHRRHRSRLTLGYAASGLTIIAPDEVGVVRHWGVG